MFNCCAWSYAEGPPEVNDVIVLPTLIFAATRAACIAKFRDKEVIPANNERLPENGGPYDLDDIEIGVDVIPTVPNWRP